MAEHRLNGKQRWKLIKIPNQISFILPLNRSGPQLGLSRLHQLLATTSIQFSWCLAVLIYVLFEQIGGAGATSHLEFPFCGSKLGIVRGSKLLQVSNFSENVSEGSESGMIKWGTTEQGRKVSCFPWVSWKAN